jgi:hypothetical protein
MGSWRDAMTEAWQEEHGIAPAAGDRARLLEEMSQKAFELIKIIELERSGIRDGDGYWHGSNPMAETAPEMLRLCAETLPPFARPLAGGVEPKKMKPPAWAHYPPGYNPK